VKEINRGRHLARVSGERQGLCSEASLRSESPDKFNRPYTLPAQGHQPKGAQRLELFSDAIKIHVAIKAEYGMVHQPQDQLWWDFLN